jgi:diacylglycerol kinase family enzyme
MQDAPKSAPRLRRVAAVVNPLSGGVGAGAAVALARMIADRGYDLSLAVLEPDGIETAIRAALARDPDLLIVLAGDGTARQAAALCGPDGPLVAPLPGGTMNLLPNALYGQAGWADALTLALDHGVDRMISGGRIQNRSFYVAAILGAPALYGLAREALRRGDLSEAWRRVGYALRRTFAGELRYGLDGDAERRAEALIILSPMVSKAMHEETSLEAAALNIRDARETFRLAVRGAFGDWRGDPGVVSRPVHRGWARARRHIPAILDGEVHRLASRVEFVFEPRAFRALAPAPEPSP